MTAEASAASDNAPACTLREARRAENRAAHVPPPWLKPRLPDALRRSCACFLAEGWTVAATAAEHGIAERTLYRWRRPVEAGGCPVLHAALEARQAAVEKARARADWQRAKARTREMREAGILPPTPKRRPRGKPFRRGFDARRGPGIPFRPGYDSRRNDGPSLAQLFGPDFAALEAALRGPARERMLRRRRERYDPAEARWRRQEAALERREAGRWKRHELT